MAALEAADVARVDARLAEAKAALRTLRNEPWERKIKASQLLLRLMNNLAQSPRDIKFRTINEFNRRLSADVFAVAGCLEFLHAVGFQSCSSRLRLFDSDGASLTEDGLGPVTLSIIDRTRQELQDFVYRAERDERIAAEKASESNSTLKLRPFKQKMSDPASQTSQSKASVFTVLVQSVGDLTSVQVTVEATVGCLRSRIATLKRCEAQQIKLVLPSSGKVLRPDHDYEKLLEIGLSDNSYVACRVGQVDEVQTANAFVGQRIGPQAAAGLDTWLYTKECLEYAGRNGLPTERAKMLKRDLHSGALTCKEIRQMLAEEIQEITGEAAPFAEIDARYTPDQKNISAWWALTEKDRAYAKEIARDNAQGLVNAAEEMNKKHRYER